MTAPGVAGSSAWWLVGWLPGATVQVCGIETKTPFGPVTARYPAGVDTELDIDVDGRVVVYLAGGGVVLTGANLFDVTGTGAAPTSCPLGDSSSPRMKLTTTTAVTATKDTTTAAMTALPSMDFFAAGGAAYSVAPHVGGSS
ncbi:hypothetical protein GCM10011609_27500 [Lentzea pudingi]|uniref:Uncharacterized protein n=1 Tax=Lentzea pudingi TaxID=1789439 RepID=A0ABQ2HR27_9PSEU|nr:hypothetical protein GCM10011609_27500 [Lentzea pudingi]